MNNTRENKAHRINSPMHKRLFNLKEAAEYLGRPVWGVRTLIWNGKLPVIQDGRKYFIDIYDLESYIETQKTRIL
jgi:excisionase family DNA binding protein